MSGKTSLKFLEARAPGFPLSLSPHPGPVPPRPGRRSPAQLLDLQIFTRSKIMARRWLRSPRIRNTFMVPPALPRLVARTLLWELSGARGAATSPSPCLAVPQAGAAPPRSRAPAARTLGRAVTWRGGWAQDRSQEVALPTSPRRQDRRGSSHSGCWPELLPLWPCVDIQGSPHPQKPQSGPGTQLKVLMFIALLGPGKWK